MRHQKTILALLLAVLLVFAFAACSDDDGSSGTEITLMSWNVANFDGAPWDGFNKIANVVKNQQVDILILNEVQDNDNDETYFAQALTAAGWTMQYHSFSSRSDGYDSIGIFSRYPVTATTEILDPPGPRSIYKATVALPGEKTITIYGAHLKSGVTAPDLSARTNQAKQLANYIRSNHTDLGSDLIAILGDMNTMGTTAGDPVEDFLPGSTLDMLCLKDDAVPGNDFTPVNQTWLSTTATFSSGSLLDHIILSPAARNRYVSGSVFIQATTFGTNSGYSDHRSVRARLSLP